MSLIGFQKSNPRTLEWENNDCVVRASSIACGIPYEEMHAKYKEAGRKDRRGTPVFLIDEVLDYKQGIKATTRRSAWTLAQFLRVHDSGHWVMCNRNHAWAVIDGVVHDHGIVGARTRVLFAWKVK
jgi:hypothetical protein